MWKNIIKFANDPSFYIFEIMMSSICEISSWTSGTFLQEILLSFGIPVFLDIFGILTFEIFSWDRSLNNATVNGN